MASSPGGDHGSTHFPTEAHDPILRSLNRAGLAVQKTLDPNEIFRVVADELKKFGIESTFLLLDESGEQMYVAHLSYNPILIKAAEKITGLSMETQRFPLSRTPSYAQVVQTGRPVYLDDPVETVRQFLPEGFLGTVAAKIASLLSFRGGIVTPLYRLDKIIGVLGVSSPHMKPDDIPAINAFATTVGIAMDNARLYVELKNSAASLERQVQERTQELQSTARFLENIIDSTSIAITAMDLQGRFTLFNRGAEELTGYSAREMLGHRLPPGFIQVGNTPAVGQELSNRGHVDNKEATFRRKDGSLVTTEYHMSQLKDKSGKLTGLLAVAVDRSAQRKLLTELVRSERLAGVGQLASGIAHEFNNIIAGLRGFAQLSQLPGKENRLRELPTMVLSLTDRAGEIVDRLQSFAQSGDEKLRPLDVRGVLQQTCALAQRDLAQQGITLEIVGEAVPPVLGNAGLLSQVFLNLIINARHAMPNGGTLTVGTRATPSDVIVTVTDTGVGIPPEHLPRIFDPFFTTKGAMGGGEAPGTGLGLSLCYRIITDMRGRIEVQSRPGSGATFTITVPRAERETVAEMPPEVTNTAPLSMEALAEGRSLSVLLAEDEDAIRESVSEYLGLLGHRVTAVSTSQDALAAAEASTFHAAVLDLTLPGQSGVALARTLKARHPELVVFLITGAGGPQYEAAVNEAPSAGIARVLHKPFRLDDLAAILIEKTAPPAHSSS